MKKLILFIFLLFGIRNFGFAEVRYVSHSGSNTPPYLTWETAADSIMSAINISSFGDTIYVGNGVYKEIITMIPGLSLIGAGMDSTIIDTRDLAYSGFHSVDAVDSCLFKGFFVKVSYSGQTGYGISCNNNCKIILNRVSGAIRGISTGSGPFVYKNVCSGNVYGITNFDATVLKNIISVSYSNGEGILIDADSPFRTPITDSNFIQINDGSFGIQIFYGTKPTITNNTIILKDEWATGVLTGFASDTTKIFNNLIIAESAEYGITNANWPVLEYNNYLTGNFRPDEYVIQGSDPHVIKNNVVTNAGKGINRISGTNPVIQYNNSWNNQTNYGGSVDSTNLSVDPMIVNDDTTQGDLDFHLQMFSPLIDRGDPGILDKDSTRSDIGLYGGPYGEIYLYQDLPPRAPINLTGMIDTNYILLAWNKNTEADFSHYNLYRDTTENFAADSTTFAASIEDTFYLHLIPQGIDNLYFKLTAVDNQGNESEPSEELHVSLTGIINNEEFTINNYSLYPNYPNPFNPTTRIGYRLKERGYVKLYIYDIKGELIETLVNKYQEGGYYEITFDASNIKHQASSIKQLASGVYIYQIMVRNEQDIPVFTDIKKMVYIK